MFKQHHGSDLVKRGTYLCITTGEFTNVGEKGGYLPGETGSHYVKVNPLLALIVGPIAGMLFVIFLPLAVPLFMLWLVARKLGVRTPAAVRQLVDSVRIQSAQPAYAASGVATIRGARGRDNQGNTGIDVFDEVLAQIQANDHEPSEDK